MKNKLLSFQLLLFIVAFNVGYGQTAIKTPKNFPGVFAGVEWNTRSGMLGAAYERTIWVNKRLTAGLKGMHAFTYEVGNMQLMSGTYEGTSSFTALLPTVHYYTSRFNKNNRGFFLQSGLGAVRRAYKNEEVEYNKTKAGFEAGFGWQFSLGSRTTLQWSNTIFFAGEGGITITRLSMGF